jgi:hypothetical protein
MTPQWCAWADRMLWKKLRPKETSMTDPRGLPPVMHYMAKYGKTVCGKKCDYLHILCLSPDKKLVTCSRCKRLMRIMR